MASGSCLFFVLAKCDFADLGTAQDYEQGAFLVADIAEAFHQAGGKRDGIPGPEFSLAGAILAPEEFPSPAKRYEYFNHTMTVQRRTLARLHSVERHRKAMITGNGRGGFSNMADDRESLHRARDCLAVRHLFIVHRHQLGEPCDTLEHLFV